MIANKHGVAHLQCHPRHLSKKLELYISDSNFNTLTKRQRILALLICTSRCGCRITRFDAEWFGDHCLNTTISEIGRLDNIEVWRNETKRPSRFGKAVSCKEYYLSVKQIYRAEKCLIRAVGVL